MANPTERLSSHSSNRPGSGVEGIALSIPATQKPKLLEQVRHAIRVRHLSPQTELAAM